MVKTCTRNSTLDILRILATFAVVMIHCSAHYMEKFQPFTTEFIVGNVFDSLSRIGVPFFLMISGALFLDERKEISFKGMLTKYIKPLCIITFCWAILYALVYQVVYPLLYHKPLQIKKIISAILNGHFHMWYLYMIIGLYIITPFLKKFVCKENKNLVLFFILISFVVQFSIPVMEMLCDIGFDPGFSFLCAWLQKFNLSFFTGYTTYFLLGWYIVHVGIPQKWLKYMIYSLGILSLGITILYVHFTGNYVHAYKATCAFVLLYSVSAFLALSNIPLHLKEKTACRLAKLSKLTFGVYLVHIMLLTVFLRVFPYKGHPVLYIAAEFIGAVCISFFISYIMSKIPVVKKLIKA